MFGTRSIFKRKKSFGRDILCYVLFGMSAMYLCRATKSPVHSCNRCRLEPGARRSEEALTYFYSGATYNIQASPEFSFTCRGVRTLDYMYMKVDNQTRYNIVCTRLVVSSESKTEPDAHISKKPNKYKWWGRQVCCEFSQWRR